MQSRLRATSSVRQVIAGVLAAAVLASVGPAVRAQTDLDSFMRQVLERRDTNWKKLQQYVLDEREQMEMRGPSGTPLWGERRDYTWYIRDGFFVRSPVKVNGAPVPEADRQKYERDFLQRAQRLDRRARARGAADPATADDAPASNAPDDVDASAAPTDLDSSAAPTDLDGLIRQSRQPQFISSAYFLRFRFDEGRYALVGPEDLDGRRVLRIEYYPEKLFTEQRRRELREELEGDRRRPPARDSAAERAYDDELRRLMNRSSKVTLWIEPDSKQIVKYTFDDLNWNFFPGQWLARVDGVTASMTMGQPFEDVWLPRGLEMNVRLLLAFGTVDFRYTLAYENYRQADVQSKIGIPDRP